MPTISLSLPASGTVIAAGLHIANYAAIQALLNGALDDNNIASLSQSKVAFAPWSNYTPTWGSAGTQPSIGNGSLAGRYMRIGSLVHVRIDLVAGTTTTYGTGQYTLSLPFTAADAMPWGSGRLTDQFVKNWFVVPMIYSATAMTLHVMENSQAWSGTSPFTMGATDDLSIGFSYVAV